MNHFFVISVLFQGPAKVFFAPGPAFIWAGPAEKLTIDSANVSK